MLLIPVKVNCLVAESPGIILLKKILFELFSYVIDSFPAATAIVLDVSGLLILAAKYEYVIPKTNDNSNTNKVIYIMWKYLHQLVYSKKTPILEFFWNRVLYIKSKVNNIAILH